LTHRRTLEYIRVLCPYGGVAQLVEHSTFNRVVGGSMPSAPTINVHKKIRRPSWRFILLPKVPNRICSSLVEHRSEAPGVGSSILPRSTFKHLLGPVAQLESEHRFSSPRVVGSSPTWPSGRVAQRSEQRTHNPPMKVRILTCPQT
jgi:hypothetical protein